MRGRVPHGGAPEAAPSDRGSPGRARHRETQGALHPGVGDPRSRHRDGWSALTDGVVIAFVGLFVAVALAAAWTASPVGPVPRWLAWRSADGSVVVEHPYGWRVMDLSSRGIRQVVFARSEWVRIHLAVDEAGGRIGPPGLYERALPAAIGYATAEAVHREAAADWSVLFGQIQEGAATRTVLAGWPAVWSQFEASRGAVLMRGYRATIVGTHRTVLIGGAAPAAYWDEFGPIALRMISTLRLAG